ncbi:hypothetical protein GQX73_g8891 [Xylaria multiplex]|uniref:F-box domain-containing protein n=1 Tax=Xylaria multiplex TaxID=323545 RepID=A0A7C8IIS1_9PEZI|nr:hypothetical protein GQX73_g8891 [Xylaria multiplex]
MPFSALPPEIVRHIILHAVKVRGIKRAGRLRYVSKSWDAAVMDAICASGVLEGHERHCSYLPRYFAQRVMGRTRTLPRPLCIIRQVAARIVSHRNKGRDGGDNYDGFRDCVLDLCQSCDELIGHRHMYLKDDWFIDAESPILPVDEHDKQFRQALLAAAAWTNEVALVHEILPFFRDCLYLISPSGYNQLGFMPVFGYPVSLAAYRGNNEILSLLLGAVTTDGPKDLEHLGNALTNAILGNQSSTVELILEPQQKWVHDYNMYLVYGIRGTADIGIFKRLVPFAREYPIHILRLRSKPDYWRVKTLPAMLCSVASDGNLAILKHLVEEEGAELTERWYRIHKKDGPVLNAARDGRIDALVYLLGKGMPLPTATPQFAARSRNPDIMRIIIEGDMQRNSNLEFGPALVTAIERENEQVVRLLLHCEHVRIDEESKAQAQRHAEELGLESMAEMIVVVEDNDRNLTDNVVSKFLLVSLLLLKMKETATRFDTMPRLTIVSSDPRYINNQVPARPEWRLEWYRS